MLDWLIVGGGIHGTSLSLALTRRDRVPRDHIAVLDPHDDPLTCWNLHTNRVGMRYLRSPGVHHLHYDPFALRTFRATRSGQPLDSSIPRYERPAFDLFQAYSQTLMDRYNLDSLRVQGWARGLTRLAQGWRVETDDGALEARRVILAIGVAEQPHIPSWAREIQGEGAPVYHIFDPNAPPPRSPKSNIVIIGGGISAAQVALQTAHASPGAVTMLARHALRVRDFDSDPCWVGPLCLHDFHKIDDFDQRRATLTQARYPGSMPPDVADALDAATREGRLRVLQGEVDDAVLNHNQLTLHLVGGGTLTPDAVVLATGFDSHRPGGNWLDAAIQENHLPVAACGYPILDPTLCWSDGLYVTGPLAELEIGPTSRNIIGARLAGERLRPVVLGQ